MKLKCENRFIFANLLFVLRVLVNHNAMRAFVYVSVTLWARGSHFVWPRKWRQQLIKVIGKT